MRVRVRVPERVRVRVPVIAPLGVLDELRVLEGSVSPVIPSLGLRDESEASGESEAPGESKAPCDGASLDESEAPIDVASLAAAAAGASGDRLVQNFQF